MKYGSIIQSIEDNVFKYYDKNKEKQVDKKYRIGTRVIINKYRYNLDCYTGFICTRRKIGNQEGWDKIDYIIRLDNGQFISVKHDDYIIDNNSYLTDKEKIFLSKLESLLKETDISIDDMMINSERLRTYSVIYGQSNKLELTKEVSLGESLIDKALLKIVESNINVQIVDTPKFIINKGKEIHQVEIPCYYLIYIEPNVNTLSKFIEDKFIKDNIKSIYLYSLLTGADLQNHENWMFKNNNIITPRVDLNYMYIRAYQKTI